MQQSRAAPDVGGHSGTAGLDPQDVAVLGNLVRTAALQDIGSIICGEVIRDLQEIWRKFKAFVCYITSVLWLAGQSVLS
jgi:hypothetical protein